MTATETLFAGQARATETKTAPKTPETRSADEDPRFTEELRNARAEEKRAQERRAEARDVAERRADERRAEQARSEDARAEKARKEKAEAKEAGKAEDAPAKDEAAKTEEAAEAGADVEVAIETAAPEAADTKLETVVESEVEIDVAVAKGDGEAVASDKKTEAADLPGAAAKTPETGGEAVKVAAQVTDAPKEKVAAKADAETAQTPAAARKAAETAAANGAAKAETDTTAKQAQGPAAPAQAQRAAETAAPDAKPEALPEEAQLVKELQALAGKGKRGLGHEAAQSLAEARNSAKTAGNATGRTETDAAQAKPASANPANAQRNPADVLTAQAVMPKADALPQDMKLTGLDAWSGTPQVNNDGSATAPQPSVTVRAIMTATAQPGTPAQPQTPARDIAVNMARNLQNGNSKFEIRLDPPELGRIDVKMEMTQDGRVHAHLTVDRPETLDMLQRDSRALEKALADAGLQMDQDGLGYSLRDNDGGAFAMDRDGTQGQQKADAGDTETDATELAAAQHVYALKIGAGGGIDIRI